MKNIKKNNIIIILCNIPCKKNILNIIINNLLKKKITCCINYINNIKSIFFWKNKIKKTKEIKIIIKTLYKFKNIIIKLIEKNHPYKIPEILIIKSHTNNKYYKWISNNLI